MEARKRGFRSVARGQEEPPENYVSMYSGKRVSRPPLAGNTDKRVTGRDASRKVFKKQILRLSWHREQGAPGPPKTAHPKGGRGACPGHRRDRRQLRKRGQDSDVRGQVGGERRALCDEGWSQALELASAAAHGQSSAAGGGSEASSLSAHSSRGRRALAQGDGTGAQGPGPPRVVGHEERAPCWGHADRTHGPGGAGVGCRARRGPPGTPTRCPPHLPAAPCAADASAVPMFTRCPKNSGTTFRLGQKQTPPWGTVADGVGPGPWTEAAVSAGLKARTAADLRRSTPSLAAPAAVRGPRARQVAPEPRRLPKI